MCPKQTRGSTQNNDITKYVCVEFSHTIHNTNSF